MMNRSNRFKISIFFFEDILDLQLKSNKAPGPDDLINELINNGGGLLVKTKKN